MGLWSARSLRNADATARRGHGRVGQRRGEDKQRSSPAAKRRSPSRSVSCGSPPPLSVGGGGATPGARRRYVPPPRGRGSARASWSGSGRGDLCTRDRLGPVLARSPKPARAEPRQKPLRRPEPTRRRHDPSRPGECSRGRATRSARRQRPARDPSGPQLARCLSAVGTIRTNRVAGFPRGGPTGARRDN